MKCRVLYLVGQLGAGGSERQLCALLEHMGLEDYEPAVVVWHYHEEATYVSSMRFLGVPLYGLPTTASRLWKLRALRDITNKIDPEIIHSYSFFTNFAAWWAALGTRRIALGSVRSDFRYAMEGSGFVLGRCNARWPRSQIFNSASAASAAQRASWFWRPDQPLVVRNGLDLQSFYYTPVAKEGGGTIVGLGSLLPAKRWDRLLSAVAALKRSGYVCQLRLIGDGPMRDTLQQQVYALDITDRVTLMGHQTDISACLAAATCLVHTADSEGCPNAVMEAMACGRPVVAMDAGDISLLVEDGTTGFVVPPGDEARLVQCLATLLADCELCCRMGRAGRAKAEREFGLDRLIAQTFAAYRTAGWRDHEQQQRES
jgi:glycosyltransferase involved in cell wall biosynthesis